jgi:hypothetical protein
MNRHGFSRWYGLAAAAAIVDNSGMLAINAAARESEVHRPVDSTRAFEEPASSVSCLPPERPSTVRRRACTRGATLSG